MAKVYSVKEAAEQLGISGQRVRQLLAEGRIEGRQLGHQWVVLDPSYTKLKRGRKFKHGKGHTTTAENGKLTKGGQAKCNR